MLMSKSDGKSFPSYVNVRFLTFRGSISAEPAEDPPIYSALLKNECLVLYKARGKTADETGRILYEAVKRSNLSHPAI